MNLGRMRYPFWSCEFVDAAGRGFINGAICRGHNYHFMLEFDRIVEGIEAKCRQITNGRDAKITAVEMDMYFTINDGNIRMCDDKANGGHGEDL